MFASRLLRDRCGRSLEARGKGCPVECRSVHPVFASRHCLRFLTTCWPWCQGVQTYSAARSAAARLQSPLNLREVVPF